MGSHDILYFPLKEKYSRNFIVFKNKYSIERWYRAASVLAGMGYMPVKKRHLRGGSALWGDSELKR